MMGNYLQEGTRDSFKKKVTIMLEFYINLVFTFVKKK